MVNTTCAVIGCTSSSRIKERLRFHQFPRRQERCDKWVQACRRPGLVGRTVQSLKNKYICSIHFEIGMYGKRSLKKTALPTLFLPTENTVHTRKPRVKVPRDDNQPDDSLDRVFVLSAKRSISKRKISENHNEAGTSEIKNTGIKKCRRPRVDKQASKRRKHQCISKSEDVTKDQFLRFCDKFLSPKLIALVKEELSVLKEQVTTK